MNSYENVTNWLTKSGLFISDFDDSNCGGVHSFYDEKINDYGFLYPEITGYFISTLRFLDQNHHKDLFLKYAKYSSDWLIKIYKKYGSIIQGVDSSSKNTLSYSFDSAICAKGLLDYFEISRDKKYLDYATQILTDLKNDAISSDGSVKPFKDVSTNKYLESNEVWYKQEGCLHIKTSMAFFHLYSISKNNDFLEISTKICDKISNYQNSDGSIRLHENSDVINLHTLSYSLEGLLYGFHVTQNEEYLKKCKKAIDWCTNQIQEDGSISLWFNSKYNSKAAYPIAQLIRIMILLDRKNNITENKLYLDNLFKFLISLQANNINSKINGGFYEEFYKSLFGWKKRLRINSWTSMFALQAISWYQNYEKINFNDQIQYLY